MPYLSVRILGICCLLDPAQPSDSFRKRVVIPIDDMMSPAHIPYIEFESKDVDPNTPGLSQEYTHHNGAVQYRRYTLQGQSISIDPVDISADFVVTNLYSDCVPPMTKVCSSLRAHPQAGCFVQSPPASLLAAYFDISHGTLTTGPLNEARTAFVPHDQFAPARLPQWVDLLLPVTSSTPVITLSRFGNGQQPVRIKLKEGVDQITIGHQPESEITGTPVADPEEHFHLFYNLADKGTAPPMMKAPVPTKALSLVNGCSPTNWP